MENTPLEAQRPAWTAQEAMNAGIAENLQLNVKSEHLQQLAQQLAPSAYQVSIAMK